MPAPCADRNSPSMTSVIIRIGLGDWMMEPFPLIEVNQDLYSRLTGVHVHFVTTNVGEGLQIRPGRCCRRSRYRLSESSGMSLPDDTTNKKH